MDIELDPQEREALAKRGIVVFEGGVVREAQARGDARRVRLRSVVWMTVALLGCGAPSAHSPAPSNGAASSRSEPTSLAPGSSGRPSPTASTPSLKPRPDEAAIFARLEPDLAACYERGRKAVPTMLAGKLTLNASIDASGKATCVIPTEDTGLTKEVEDCMSERLAAERFDAGPAWTVAVPVAVRGGKVQLGSRAPESVELGSVETYRMADAFDVLESLVPELQACIRELDRSSGVRSVMVGARVGTDGRTQCALATGAPADLPAQTSDCTENVLRQARFPPPSGGPGLILVPITVMRGK